MYQLNTSFIWIAILNNNVSFTRVALWTIHSRGYTEGLLCKVVS